MEHTWLISTLWIGLALLSALISIRIGISVALVEIVVGSFGGNLLGIAPNEWITYLASVGAILLTFLAGTELDPVIVRKHLGATLSIGVVGFVAPYLGVLIFAHYGLGWPWPQAQIAGIALSTTSVAVVYAVMVETGFNQTEIGKIILAGCFVNDVGTVLALGVVFANYNIWLVLFAVATALAMWFTPKLMPWFTKSFGGRVSEPEAKLLLLVLFALATLAATAKSEAVLPAYLLGMAFATFFIKERALAQRLRVITFTLLTPFYFLKAGSLVKFETIGAADRSDYHVPSREDGDQVRGHLAADANVQVRPARGDVYDIDDVHRTDVRDDFGSVRFDQRHHRPGAIHDPGHRRDRQCRGADPDCPALVPARVQADCQGGRPCSRKS